MCDSEEHISSPDPHLLVFLLICSSSALVSMEIVLDGEAVDSGLFETFFTYLSQRKRFVAKSDFGDRAMTSASGL